MVLRNEVIRSELITYDTCSDSTLYRLIHELAASIISRKTLVNFVNKTWIENVESQTLVSPLTVHK